MHTGWAETLTNPVVWYRSTCGSHAESKLARCSRSFHAMMRRCLSASSVVVVPDSDTYPDLKVLSPSPVVAQRVLRLGRRGTWG